LTIIKKIRHATSNAAEMPPHGSPDPLSRRPGLPGDKRAARDFVARSEAKNNRRFCTLLPGSCRHGQLGRPLMNMRAKQRRSNAFCSLLRNYHEKGFFFQRSFNTMHFYQSIGRISLSICCLIFDIRGTQIRIGFNMSGHHPCFKAGMFNEPRTNSFLDTSHKDRADGDAFHESAPIALKKPTVAH
jgi:hypothetical protein